MRQGNEYSSYEKPLLHSAAVLDNEPLARGVRLLRTEKPFVFRAGQCAALSTSATGPVRYYSMAGGDGEDHLAFLYDVVEEGELTPLLRDLTPGRPVYLSDPFGTFVDDEEESVWIATGTGVAPFRSFARSFRREVLGKRKALVYGGRTIDRIYFRSELTTLLAERLVCCCPECGESEEGIFRGRLGAWFSGAARENRLVQGCRYFLCGNSEMVVTVRDILISAGVPFERILSEIYF